VVTRWRQALAFFDREVSSDEAHRLRASFLLLALLGGAAVSLVLALTYAVFGRLGEASGATAGAVVCGLVLALWVKTRSLSTVSEIYGAAFLLLFAGVSLALGHPDLLVWLALGPLTLLFFAGRRAGVRWLLIVMAAVLGASGLFLSGVVEPRVTSGLAALLVRTALFIPVVTALGFLFETVRLGAMDSLREARAVAEQADQNKDRFLANVSHEIRTPLNGVLGTTEALLSGRDAMAPAVREGLGVIQQSGHLLRVLIDDLLDVTRMREGKLTLSQAPFAVAQLVQEVGALHAGTAQLRGLSYRVEVQVPRELSLVGDRVRVAQVLNNLIANAVKFTLRGEVVVTARATPVAGRQVLRLAVSDTGPGIGLEERERLFTPFSQLSAARGLGGTGLGLVMCQQLARLMGAVIELDSQPGKGSTFSLVAPMEQASAPKALAAAQGQHRFSGRALVVDDNAINRRVAAALLEQAGLQVFTADDGAAALALLTRERVDVIFMDVHMPVMNGHQATRELRRREQVAGLRRTPVIALTASVLEEDLRLCFEAGMEDGLAKPMTVAALHAVLDRFAPTAPVAPSRATG